MLKDVYIPFVTKPIEFESKGHSTFAQAIDAAQHVPHYSTRGDVYIHIGKAQASCGVNPDEVISRLYDQIDQPGEVYRDRVYKGLVDIELMRGNFEAVDTVFSQAPHMTTDLRVILDLAERKARYGLDYSHDLVHAELYVEEGGRRYPNVAEQAELAKTIYRVTGVIPKDVFAVAEEDIEAYKNTRHHKTHTPDWYNHVSKAYAICGDFEKAAAFCEKMEGVSPIEDTKHISETLHFIAQEQLERRMYSEAIDTLTRALNRIDTTVPEPAHLKSYLDDDKSFTSVRLLATQARARGLNGEDPTEIFQKAVKIIPFIWGGGGCSVRAMIDIAKAQHAVGLDASPSFQYALELVHAIRHKSDYDDYYDYIDQFVGYSEVGEAAAETGHIDLAYVSLDRLINVDQTANFKSDEARLLADIAAAEIKSV